MGKAGDAGVHFLQSVLPELGYRWDGFRKPRGQVLQRIHQRIADLELKDLEEYAHFIDTHPHEWQRLEETLYVTISRFYRDRKLWDELSEQILPRMAMKQATSRLNIWSAGFCNGEEPFSIAIAAEMSGILDYISILASDRNPHLFKRAQTGRFPASSLKDLSIDERARFFTYDAMQSEYVINKNILKSVQFEIRNIRSSLPVPDDPFNLIFCRNLVFTYFDNTSQLQFLSRMRTLLKDDGLLIIGSNERLPDALEWQKLPGNLPVYKKANRNLQD